MLLTSFRRFFVTQALFGTMPKRSLISQTKEVELEIEGLKFVRLNPAEIQPKVSSTLADKPFLPGSTGRGFPEVLSPPTETFPHAVKIKDPHLHPFSKLVDGCSRYITDNLYRYGAVLLRNLPLKTTNDFASQWQGLGFQAMRYEAGAVERKRVDDSETYTATDEPPEVVIEFHNEMAYSPVYAAKVTGNVSIFRRELFIMKLCINVFIDYVPFCKTYALFRQADTLECGFCCICIYLFATRLQ